MIKKIKILKKFNKLEEKYNSSRIGGHAHTAFLVSLGTDQQEETKRFKIQNDALTWFYSHRVSDFRYIHEMGDVYPLIKQNNYLFNMLQSVHSEQDLFEALCIEWKASPDWEYSLKDLFTKCGLTKKGATPLWVFARDYLNIPSFPIDKNIKKILEKNKLPTCPWKIIYLCQEANIDPNSLNRKLCNKSNFDWSEY